ncbi:hypothetical protein R5R35_007672 [Gryllus longicercus]|uniref:Uncharacterized protein n=1 Tax=Gryllus longicercus TaxID=2509291 RepID=A0AAN9VFZ8_9ORTH
MYNVTFGVHKVHKGEESDLKNQHQGVRLQFLDKAAAPGGGGGGGGGGIVGCQGVGSVVRANIRNNPRYLVFVERVAPHVFRPRAEPLVKTKQTMQQVRKAIACGGESSLLSDEQRWAFQVMRIFVVKLPSNAVVIYSGNTL